MDCKGRIREIADGFSACRNAFTAIGDQARQLILITLLESELTGIRVGEIAQKTHMTRPSASHHLQILKEAGIVAMRKSGTKNYYYLSREETQWKVMLELVSLIYDSLTHSECLDLAGGED